MSMLHPSYNELMSVVNKDAKEDEQVVKSRYSIVMSTAKRARQLVDLGYMEQEDHSIKPLSVAVDELYTGKVRILTPEQAEQMAAEKALGEAGEAEEQSVEQAAEETGEETADAPAEETEEERPEETE